MSAAIRWSGLDFDTAEMDTEIRGLLARVAPEGGDIRALTLSAFVRVAIRAVDQDLSMMRSERQRAQGDLEDWTPQERALQEMYTALHHLADAQQALLDAHERVMAARRVLGDL